jgi:hypothetical protein
VAKANRNKEEIRDIFELACAKRTMLIFVTPYLRFESHFVHLEGNAVHVSASRGGGDAIYYLRGGDLKLRFPHGYSFFEAPAKITGFGTHEGKRTMMVELPKEIYQNDDRKTFRVERVGNITATISTPKNEIVSASLLDVSTKGAKLSGRVLQMDKAMRVGDKIMLTIPIPKVATINCGAIVRHADGSNFGVEYTPKLDASILDPLSSWVFRKQEEEKERKLSLLDDKSNKIIIGPETNNPSSESDECRVLLVTSDHEIEETFRKLISDEYLFLHSEPSVAALKLMLAKMPHLVILHLPANNMEKRRLMKSLAAMVPSNVPILLLGTDIDSGALFELGREWKAASSIAYVKERGVFVQKLIVGMVRRHLGKGEGQIVSIDAEA